MKRLCRMALVGLVVVCLVGIMPVSARTLTIGAEDYPPFEWGMATGQMAGFTYEVVRQVCIRLECTVTYRHVPFKEALAQMKTGQQDALHSVFKTPEREQFAWYPSEALVDTTVRLMVRKEEETSRSFESLEDLRDQNIALSPGYHYSDTFNPFVTQHSKVQVAGNDTSNIQKLVQGAVDYFPIDQSVGTYLAKQLGVQDQVAFLAKAVSTSRYYIMFSKKTVSQDFVTQFAQALQEYKQSPHYQALVTKYFR